MGTNVYAIRKRPPVPYKKIQKAAKREDYETIKEQVDHYEELLKNNTVHIGKRSGGWQFLFNANNWRYYDHTKKSIMRFLHSCDHIENEYGEILTPEQFWQEYVEDFRNGLTSEQYHIREIQRAKDKREGKLEDPYNLIPSVSEAQRDYDTAKANGWYEIHVTKRKKKMPSKIYYRFSTSTDFS